ncbi:hypothetical protein [Kitasatospora sp. NBC_01266]|uniref:hypothetical protein n=1 Tax=Kitasatospora sp. NBC_01266 TaxID=2903572 RepID=UPI002E357327|nr:hypothetical protein [Kitasatospora sp. NBC_01266]
MSTGTRDLAGTAAELAAGADLLIEGGDRLHGEVRVAGFKHALVTVVAAAVVGRAPLTVANCPEIEETRVLGELLRRAGGRADYQDGSFTLDLAGLRDLPLDPELVRRIHGAAYLLPGLLARFGRVHLPASGGCRIGDSPSGSRPVQQYADVLARFGARVQLAEDGALTVRADKLVGCEIDLRDFMADPVLLSGPLYSGATKTAILAAAAAHGTTRLRHPYPKPDVTELVQVLQAMGWSITRPSATELVIEGRPDRGDARPVEHTLVSDLIEVVTWATAAVVTGGEIRLTGLTSASLAAGLAPEIKVGRRLGLRWEADGADAVVLHPDPPTRPVDVTVASHGIYSDSQPFLMLLATLAPGVSRIRETVWQGRFAHLPEFNRLGTRIDLRGSEARITGGHPPVRPADPLRAVDLRGAAALLLAALRPAGQTRLTGVHHLARGYQDLVGDLRRLGARIETDHQPHS